MLARLCCLGTCAGGLTALTEGYMAQPPAKIIIIVQGQEINNEIEEHRPATHPM